MKQFASMAFTAGLIACGLFAAPAMAQNAAQIESVKKGKSCVGCNLFQADLDYEDISHKNFSKSRLRQSDMSLSTADYTNFSGTDLSIANMYGLRATGANFVGTNLERASMVGGYFNGANFAGANLTNADLSGAELKTAKGLSQAQLNKACGDEATLLPKGLRIPACKK